MSTTITIPIYTKTDEWTETQTHVRARPCSVYAALQLPILHLPPRTNAAGENKGPPARLHRFQTTASERAIIRAATRHASRVAGRVETDRARDDRGDCENEKRWARVGFLLLLFGFARKVRNSTHGCINQERIQQ